MSRRGVRYYRSMPPPEEEWAGDYAAIAGAGFELVLIPVPLGGQRELVPLLRQAALAAVHGLSLVATPDATTRLDAEDVRAWAGAVRKAIPGLPLLVPVERPDGALDVEGVEWGFVAGDLLPHQVADRVRAFLGGRGLWIVGLPTDTAGQVRLGALSGLLVPDATMVYEAWRPDLEAGPSIRPGLALPDGSPSPRLRELERCDALVGRCPGLNDARPLPPEAAVVLVSEAAGFWAAAGSPTVYWGAVDAAGRALASRGAHVEFAPPEALSGYPVAYLPMPFALSAATADALRRYVEAGGCLVAEAGLARFDELGRTARRTPLHGLDEVFGARALDVPEPLVGEPPPTFAGRRSPWPCCGVREPLEATTGRVKATFSDGTAAIVENACGGGATRLIGTHPSRGAALDKDRRYAQVILDSLAFGRVRPRVLTTAPQTVARLLEVGGGHVLCAFNIGATLQEAKLRVSRAVGGFRRAINLATGKQQRLLNNALRTRLEPGEGLLLRLNGFRRFGAAQRGIQTA